MIIIVSILCILLILPITFCFMAMFIVVTLHKSLQSQLCYTFYINKQAYEAYQKIKKEGCVYYENFHERIKSPTYETGNEIVKLDSGIGVYIDGNLVITGFYNKMVEDLIKNHVLA